MRARRRGAPRVARALIFLVQVLAVVLSFELSGAAALASEIVTGGDAAGRCCTDCPSQTDGKDCPPDCPSCHCSHGGVVLPPSFEDTLANASTADAHVAPAPREASVPQAPPLPSVYRPPRVVATTS